MEINFSEETNIFLLAVHLKGKDPEETKDSVSELESLAVTLNFNVVGQEIQNRESPESRTYIGTGKLKELKAEIQEKKVNLVIFNHDLSPKQSKNIEDILECMVWDRTQVILEIFDNHARTSESRIQVELARLNYMLPRLVGMWAHLDREKGGIGIGKGMGEKQVNVDRTLVRKRIRHLEKQLEKKASEKKTQNKSRNKCIQIGIVGYTNAGKSTIMNLLTGDDLLVQNKLFATLDSTTRRLTGMTKPDILISDTVGFIRDLPHSLIASFRSTLEAVKEADLLLHVVDASNPRVQDHIETNIKVLEEVGGDKIPTQLVLNKADLIEDEMDRLILENKYKYGVSVSAIDPASKNTLRSVIKKRLEYFFVRETIVVPYEDSAFLATLYDKSIIEENLHEDDGMHITYTMNRSIYKKLKEQLVKYGSEEEVAEEY